MRRVAAFLSVMFVSCGAMGTCAAGDEKAGDEQSRFQGKWQLIYAETDGKVAPADRIRQVHVEIKGDRNSVFVGDECIERDLKYTVDTEATPKTVDNTLKDGKTIRGIYELDGDTLVSCVADVDKERPTEFTAGTGSGHTLRIFMRVKPTDGPKEKAIREELMRFGGVWKYKSLEMEGKSMPDDAVQGSLMIIQGNRFVNKIPQQTLAGFFTVDPTATPKTIDVTLKLGRGKQVTHRGIYELSDDTYRVSMKIDSQARPANFETAPGSGNVVQVLKKDQPSKP